MDGRTDGRDPRLFLEPALDLGLLAVVRFAMLHGQHLGLVALGLAHVVLDRLDADLVVVLVDLAVDGDRLLDHLDGHDRLLGHGGLEVLTDDSLVVVVTVAGTVSVRRRRGGTEFGVFVG